MAGRGHGDGRALSRVDYQDSLLRDQIGGHSQDGNRREGDAQPCGNSNSPSREPMRQSRESMRHKPSPSGLQSDLESRHERIVAKDSSSGAHRSDISPNQSPKLCIASVGRTSSMTGSSLTNVIECKSPPPQCAVIGTATVTRVRRRAASLFRIEPNVARTVTSAHSLRCMMHALQETMSAKLPEETVRLVALSASGLLDTPDDYAFDCASNIGSQLFSVPICMLILTGAERNWTNLCAALEAHERAGIDSFCDRVVDTGEPIIVEDALADGRCAENAGGPPPSRLRFYAGYPIRAASGVVLGALCLMNFEPMSFSSAQLLRLQELAFLTELSLFARRIGTAQKALVAKLDSARRESLVDSLLRIWNRGGVTTILDQLHQSSAADRLPFSILMIDIDRFKRINDRHGHIAGDAVLKGVTRALQASMRPDDEIGRYGGDEFIAILPNTNAAMAMELANRISKTAAELRVDTFAGSLGCTLSIGIAEWAPQRPEPVQALVHRADVALLSAKRHGRNCVLVSQRAA